MSKALKHKWLQAYQQEKERETENGAKPALASQASKGTSVKAAGEACPPTPNAVGKLLIRHTGAVIQGSVASYKHHACKLR